MKRVLLCVDLHVVPCSELENIGKGNSSGNSRILYSSNPSQNIWTDINLVSVLEFLSFNELWTKRIFQPPNLLKLNGENGILMKGEKEWKFCPHSFKVHEKPNLFFPKDIPLELDYRRRVAATWAHGESRLNETHINAKLESNGARRIGRRHCWGKLAEPTPLYSLGLSYRSQTSGLWNRNSVKYGRSFF